MVELRPANVDEMRELVRKRLGAAQKEAADLQERLTIEWRGQQRSIPVVAMPVKALYYNPFTHRIRAQRSLDAARDAELKTSPYGPAAQNYLHSLLMGDPTNPEKEDPTFAALKEDIREHGQSDPGIITHDGVLINGNTRRAALRELGSEHIRVGVLPEDAGLDDIESIELSLQLRKDYKRDYSFVNSLLAIDERVKAGRPVKEILHDFRVKQSTFERSIWILGFIREAIKRSEVETPAGPVAMRLVDFEKHQGKLEELYRAYNAMKVKQPDDAAALREQRLLALALNRSKTDLRLIEADFAEKYMKAVIPEVPEESSSTVKIPGLSVVVEGQATKVVALRTLTDRVLKARATVEIPLVSANDVGQEQIAEAKKELSSIEDSIQKALDQAGRNGRVLKVKLAAVDRLEDANDDLKLAVDAVADARSKQAFSGDELDEALVELRGTLMQLARLVLRSGETSGDGLEWLETVAKVSPVTV